MSGAIDPLDEIYHPNGREMKHIWESQVEVPAPAPSPGDKPPTAGTLS